MVNIFPPTACSNYTPTVYWILEIWLNTERWVNCVQYFLSCYIILFSVRHFIYKKVDKVNIGVHFFFLFQRAAPDDFVREFVEAETAICSEPKTDDIVIPVAEASQCDPSTLSI